MTALTYRLFQYRANLDKTETVTLAIVVEQEDKATVRFRGEAESGQIDWSLLSKDFYKHQVTSFESWIMESWRDWLLQTLEDSPEKRSAQYRQIAKTCPDLLMTEPQDIPKSLAKKFTEKQIECLDSLQTIHDRQQRVDKDSVSDAVNSLSSQFLVDPLADRLTFLFGRYERHPVVNALPQAELVGQNGEVVYFDYIVQRLEEYESPGYPSLVVFRLVTCDKGNTALQVQSAVNAFADAEKIGIQITNKNAAILTDMDAASITVINPTVRVIPIYSVKAPFELQELIQPWVWTHNSL